ncbi:MAG: hypothetical protein HW416_1682 [Chloroflexi bacterium]|nr:hypothetical protein [Chloroflexota bacterium]
MWIARAGNGVRPTHSEFATLAPRNLGVDLAQGCPGVYFQRPGSLGLVETRDVCWDPNTAEMGDSTQAPPPVTES